MSLKLLKVAPKKSLNAAFLKLRPLRSEMDLFKSNLITLLSKINESESEENQKNHVRDFLLNTYYAGKNEVNTKGRQDLVIHIEHRDASPVGVILETKRPANKSEWISPDKANTKALHELVLYFLRERVDEKNNDIRHLVATNVYEWYIFDASVFDKIFYHNKKLVRDYEAWRDGQKVTKDTNLFYTEIARPFIESLNEEIPVTFFDLRAYDTELRNADKADDKKLIALQKLLSPHHLLRVPFANDSNSLDKRFYSELLHIIGLTETKEGGKKLIGRHKPGERLSGSILEDAIIQIDSLDKLSRISKPGQYGADKEERLFNIALELSITWVNRILFLKLLEGQLVSYHQGAKEYLFLHKKVIREYDDLNTLFFQVLAKRHEDRHADVRQVFERVPYLNSSLFEPTELEHETIFISNLRDEKTIPVHSQTVLKDSSGKKRTGDMPTLEYLFEFLNAYDFSSEGSEDIQEDNKTLINASVLGLIFEKINGYKDGSFFTPGFITMYMCRETIRRAVVQKFNEAKSWSCTDLTQLYNKIEDRTEANTIVNSLHICDPAVGSGHFLVSALNEIIAIKGELGILQDESGKRLKDYAVEVINDELIIKDENGDLFAYNPKNAESRRIQKILFHEKQTIIENCLFGVDINPNSVKICRLRLWIELLKNAYYKKENELETLPNIDINIKCGNSLVSRFALDADIRTALKKSKWTIDSYKTAVSTYRNTKSREIKKEMEGLILQMKQKFSSEIRMSDPNKKRLDKLASELYHRFTGTFLFEPQESYGSKDDPLEKKKKAEQEKLEKEIELINQKLEESKNNVIYNNSFEWRFEFPEVLNDEGDFIGFDVVIGNPPYFSMSKIKDQADYFLNAGYETYSKGADIYCLFYELGGRILKANGYLTYITSNSWLRAIYGELLKAHFMKSLQPITLLNIEDVQIFEEATVESNIITLQKRKLTDTFSVVNLSSDYMLGASLSDYFDQNHFEFSVSETSEWFIGNQTVSNLKAKIELQGKQLKEFNVRINFGIKTGFNEAFIIDESKKDELIQLDPKIEEIIKPILRGRDLKKYSYENSHKWVICTFPSLNIDINKFSVLKDYFLGFGKKRLEQSGKLGSRKKTSNQWFETQDSISYWKDFEKPKIVWGEISDKPKFAYDDASFYAEATTFLMTGEKLKFLLAILNSKVSEWYFNLIGTTTGMGTNRWKKYKIELLPIKVPFESQEQEIEKLVDQILTLKSQDPSADTTTLEAEIDRMVYDLYGLTEEERKIVEEE